MSEIPWWGWALAGAAVLVLVAGRRRATTILSAVLMGGAAVAALLRAFLPPVPRAVPEQLAGGGVLPPSGFTVALLLAGCTVALGLLAVFGPPRRTGIVALLVLAGVAGSAATLLAAGPLATATTERIAALGVDSTTAAPGATIRHGADAVGPVAGTRVLWSSPPGWQTAALVPGSDLLVLAGRGVEVLSAADGTPLWHYRVPTETQVAVDVSSGRIALVASRSVVLLDLATGRRLDRIVLPGDDYWWLVTEIDGGVQLTGSRILLRNQDQDTVLALDLNTRQASVIDRTTRPAHCRYTLAAPVSTVDRMRPVLIRDGRFCGSPPEFTFLTTMHRRTLPLTGPTDPCANGCAVYHPQSSEKALVFQVDQETALDAIVVWPVGSPDWRYRPEHPSDLTLLPDGRLIVQRVNGPADVYRVSEDTAYARGVRLPGNFGGPLNTAMLYREVHQGDTTRMVVLDPVTFQQIGPAAEVPAPANLISAADGRLVVSAGYRSDRGSSIVVLGNP